MALPLLLAGASAGLSLFGGMSARSDAQDAARQQRELGILNAGYIREEGAEQLRRREFTMDRVEGRTSALNAASGLGGKSQQLYFKEMKKQHGYELDWMRKSTESRAKIAKKGGGLAADQTLAAGNAAMWGGIGGALKSIGSIV